MGGMVFNPPPNWPKPPDGWSPPAEWKPDPSWPPPPLGWELWIPQETQADTAPVSDASDTTSTGMQTSGPPQPSKQSPERVSTSGSDSYEELQAEVERLRAEVASLRTRSGQDTDGIVDLNDGRILQEVGIYNYHHPLENAVQYKDRLKALRQSIKDMVRAGDGILASDMFTYNNSLVKGRKMTEDFSKLMLRAYNAEADICVRVLRAGNVVTAKKRLGRAVESIARLGAMMEMRVNPDYHALRFEELELTADYLMKVKEEREAAREERARLREQRRAEKELEAERERLNKERTHYMNALATLRASNDEQAVHEMEQRLEDIDKAIEHNDYRAANIRAGYVYVISNPGSLEKRIVKIGMTRRLEPMDRVRELGDASVPFPFDVYALFFADDAAGLRASCTRRSPKGASIM